MAEVVGHTGCNPFLNARGEVVDFSAQVLNSQRVREAILLLLTREKFRKGGEVVIVIVPEVFLGYLDESTLSSLN